MTTSPTPFFSELIAGHAGPPIPEAKRAYFRARLRNRIFNFILEKFLTEQDKGLTKAALARRIGKAPEIITRWLAAPSNLELDSVSDLLIGISAEELTPLATSPLARSTSNFLHASDWLDDSPAKYQSDRVQPPHPKRHELGTVIEERGLPRQLIGRR